MDKNELASELEEWAGSIDWDKKDLFTHDRVAYTIKKIVTRWGNWRKKVNNSEVEKIERDKEFEMKLKESVRFYAITYFGCTNDDVDAYILKLRGVNLTNEEKEHKQALVRYANTVRSTFA